MCKIVEVIIAPLNPSVKHFCLPSKDENELYNLKDSKCPLHRNRMPWNRGCFVLVMRTFVHDGEKQEVNKPLFWLFLFVDI